MKNDLTEKILLKITENQILSIMKEFGVSPYKIKDNEIWFRTICHGGDSHKLCYFRNTKEFYCYTNCGKMNLFNFIMEVKDWNFSTTINFLKRRVGISDRQGIRKEENDIFSAIKLKKELMNSSKSIETIFNPTPLEAIDDTILNYFEDVYYSGWIDEGISIETMQKYNIKWYGFMNHIIIPHYNISGDLVGIRRRTLQERELLEGNKYKPETIQNVLYAHSLNFNLYGLDKNKDAIKRHKKAILVEAEKSVLLSDTYYGDESITVATCGFNISNWQRRMLLELGVEEIILGYDKDFNPNDFLQITDENDLNYKKYINFCERIHKFSRLFGRDCNVSTLWDEYDLLQLKDSPFDRGKEKFEELYKRKIIMDEFNF